jgi:hypothetical protein
MDDPTTIAPDTSEAPPAELLRAFLTDRDAPCPQCGYNLRDLHGDRCPECGELLVLRVNVAEPRQGALIAGLVGLSAGAGLSGLLLIYMLIQLLRERNWSSPEMYYFAGINTAGLLIEGTAILLWLRHWRRIRRRPRSTRVALAVACWGLTLLNITIFSFAIK